MSDKQDRAHKLVKEFEQRAPKGVFTKIGWASVAAGLHARIDSPYSIDQGSSSLCGPAALVVDVASSDPESYAQFVIGLYEKGNAKIKKLDITPGTDLKNYALPASGPNAADWIPLASIRDSKNWILDYQSVGDQVAGITAPGSLAQWAREIGYTKVVDKTLPIRWQRTENLWEAAVRHEVNGYKSFLLINSHLLDAEPKEGWGYLPNHWVLLISAQMTNSGDAKLQVYTWGQKRMVPPSGMVSAKVVEAYYRGFVAAKY
ncbi:MAG TPA: hypothetical protein PK156_28375 [Polyangium sp.]|nr:hypothetical protein [Polyangium sp.]